MKKRLIGFLRKYWILFLTNSLLIFGLYLSEWIFGDKCIIDGGMLTWEASDLYLLFVFPLYAVLHGILSCVFLNKVWTPNVILFLFIVFVNFLSSFEFENLVSFEFYTVPLILFSISIVFSLFTKLYKDWWIEEKRRANKDNTPSAKQE